MKTLASMVMFRAPSDVRMDDEILNVSVVDMEDDEDDDGGGLRFREVDLPRCRTTGTYRGDRKELECAIQWHLDQVKEGLRLVRYFDQEQKL